MDAFAKSLNIPKNPKQLTILDAISLDSIVNIPKLSSRSDLPLYMLRRIMSLDTSSRKLPSFASQENSQKEIPISLSNFLDEEEEEDLVHPMDVFLYLFSISTPIFRQTLVNQAAKCQLSLPLIVYDSEKKKATFNHFAFQTLLLNRYVDGKDTKCFSALEEPLPIVSFIRVGECGSSQKSEILNRILNVRHEYFFYYNCPDSAKRRFLLDGTVEIAWYLHKHREGININRHFILLNLRGDASLYPLQSKFIGAVSTLVYVFVPISRLTADVSQILMEFSETFKSKVLFLVYKTGNEKIPNPEVMPNILNDQNCTIILRKKNISQDCKLISDSISQCLHANDTDPVSLLECIETATNTGMLCDFQAKEIREKQKIVDSICKDIPPDSANNSTILAELKGELLPIQGFFRNWAESNRELQLMSSCGKQNVKEYLETIKNKKSEARLSQIQSLTKPSHLLCEIICICECKKSSQDARELNLFWDLLKNKLNAVSRMFLPLLYTQYKEWMLESYSFKDSVSIEERKDRQNTVKRKLFDTAECITRSSLGIEHIFRELGQVHEAFIDSNDSQKKNSIKHRLNCSPTLLAGTAAHLILQGHSFEIVNGDDNHVPTTWVSDVLTRLSEIVGADKQIFVVSVLGIQSSGKSTLLNTMFGIDFPVSSGRCTRGLFMQMIPITDKLRSQLGYDYLLLLDTEGLRAPELSGGLSYKRDNEMATFTVGLGDLTLINIKGESHSEVQDILQITVIAFMRMRLTFSKPKCIFVHQNVGDIQAKTNLMLARRNLIETLDEMTLCAAQQENKEMQFNQFCDVIEFHPEDDVFYFPGLFEGEPPMTSIAPGYIEKAQELRSRILTSISSENRNFLTLMEWRKKLLGLWSSVLKENFVFSYKNILEVNARIELDNSLCNWHSNLTQDIAILKSEYVNRLYNVETQHLNDTMDNIRDELYQSIDSFSSHKDQIMNYFFFKHEKKAIFEQWKFHTEEYFRAGEKNALEQVKRDCEIICKVQEQKQAIEESLVSCRRQIFPEVRQLFDTANNQVSFDNPEYVNSLFEEFWRKWKPPILISPIEAIDITSDLQRVFFECPQLQKLDIYSQRKHLFFEKEKYKTVGLGEFDEVSRLFTLSQNENYFSLVVHNKSSTYIERMCSYLPFASKKDEGQHKFTSIANEHTKTIENIIGKLPQNSNYTKNYFLIVIGECLNLIKQHNKSETVSNARHSLQLANLYIFDFIFFACCRAIRSFEALHENYLSENSMELKLEELKSNLGEIFFQICTGIQSEKLCADKLAVITFNGMKEFLKDRVSQLLHKLFLSDPEHGTTYSSRASLQLSVLKHLVKMKNFQAYISYVESPFAFIDEFIQRNILEYSQKEHVLQNLHANITQITTEMRQVCKTGLSHGSFVDWKQRFHKAIINFVRGVKLSDMDILDVYNIGNEVQFSELFEQSFKESIEKFNWITWMSDVFTSKQCNDLQEKITNTLVECKALCPFCREPCQLSAGEHEHYCGTFHRPQGVSGWHYVETGEIVVEECTTDIQYKQKFLYEDKWYEYENYRSVNEYFNSWKILGEDSIASKYWQWVLYTFHNDFVQHYGILENDTIKEWSNLTEEEIMDDIEKHYQNYIFKTIK